MFAFSSFLTATGLLASLVQAAPSGELVKRDDFEPGKTDYTVKQIQDTFMKNNEVIKDKCVFYVGEFKQSAIDWAKAKGDKETLYTKYIEDTNSDRYPFAKDKDPRKSYEEADPNRLREWWSITSRAYADLCQGTVWFMWDEKRAFSTAGVQTIWLSDELPQMRGNDQITAVKIVVPKADTPAADWEVKDYPNWQDKTKDDPSPSNNPSNKDKPSKRSVVDFSKRSVVASTADGLARPLVRRADDAPQKPEPKTDPNPSGTLFARADDGWILGRCQVFVQQVEDGVRQGTYGITTSIYDGDIHQLVDNDRAAIVFDGNSHSIDSRLPYPLSIELQNGGADAPLVFKYGKDGKDEWNSGEDNCKTGPDGTNTRNILCSFDC
ncbi:MAG: hypothetical protein M1831_001619 [Alyxoria varia]|nr:MAG: hypothetical protein M1831_001619 [Alyxoria varia]